MAGCHVLSSSSASWSSSIAPENIVAPAWTSGEPVVAIVVRHRGNAGDPRFDIEAVRAHRAP